MKKMLKISLILIISSLISCNKELLKNNTQVIFYSTCYLNGFPETKITILKDSTFFYQKSPFYEAKINGLWKNRRDTLYFYSDKFNEIIEDDGLGSGAFKINNQATNTEKNHDIFLIKSNKLIPINDDGKIDCIYKK